MADLRAIKGNKPKEMAKGHFLECDCTPGRNRTLIEARNGIVKNAKGRVIYRGTLVYWCPKCQKVIE